MFRKKYLLGQQSSSLEYEAANGWIERPARGWPKFSTLVCNYGSVDVGNERGLWRGPRATRGLGSALRRRPMEKKKEKALSLSFSILSRAHIERKYLASPRLWNTYRRPYSPFSPFSNEFYPFDERIQTERLLRDPSMNQFAVCSRWDRLCVSCIYVSRDRLEC